MDTMNTMTDEAQSEGTDPRVLFQYIDSANIAEMLEESDLANIGQRVSREYDIDKASRSDWEDRIREALDIAMQVAGEKNYPWPNAANVKYPLITTAAIQFAARAYPAIVPGRDVVKAKVTGDDAGVPAMDQRGQPVMDAQGQPVFQVQPGAKRERGDRIASHMSWQLTEEMAEWEEDTDRLLHMLPVIGCMFRKVYYDSGKGRNCSEILHPMNCVVHYKAKSLDSAPRITHEFDLYPLEITERMRDGRFLEIELGVPADSESGDDDAPHTFLEQHRTLDLDDDGYPEPYIVTIHKDTSRVVRIVALYDEDGVMFDPETGRVMKIERIQYFQKYGFIPAADGSFYDVGFGVLLQPLNEAINSTLNQLLDAGHLQNTGGGFIGAGLKIAGGNLKFQPGQWKKVSATGGTVRDSVVPLPFQGPSPTLFQLLGLLIESGREVASVKDVMLGDQKNPNMPATSTLALIEQGMKVFTAIYKRIHRSLKGEFKKIYDLNREYLDEKVYFTVLDDPQAVKRADYEDESFDVTPVSDPTVVTDMQKMARAEFLMGFLDDPMVNRMDVLERVFDAANIDDVERVLNKNPPPNPRMLQLTAMEEREDARLSMEQAKAEADIIEKKTQALLNLARAGSEEEKNGLQAEIANLNALVKLTQERSRAAQGRFSAQVQ